MHSLSEHVFLVGDFFELVPERSSDGTHRIVLHDEVDKLVEVVVEPIGFLKYDLCWFENLTLLFFAIIS